jgi:hypothetical protein
MAEQLRVRSVPFVAVSVYRNPGRMAAALAVGNPIDERRLLAALAQALDA